MCWSPNSVGEEHVLMSGQFLSGEQQVPWGSAVEISLALAHLKNRKVRVAEHMPGGRVRRILFGLRVGEMGLVQEPRNWERASAQTWTRLVWGRVWWDKPTGSGGHIQGCFALASANGRAWW